MKKLLIISVLILTTLSGSAQNQSMQAFEEFRKGIHDKYQDFRKTILDHYADFLEGTWHEYEPLEPLKKQNAPKPTAVPTVSQDKPSDNPAILPSPVIAKIPEVSPATPPTVKPEHPKVPGQISSPFDTPKPEIPAEAKKEIPLTLGIKPQLATPILGTVPKLPIPVEEDTRPELPVVTESREGKDVIMFYGMEILVPKINFTINTSLDKVSDFARHWKILDQQETFDKFKETVLPHIENLGLNDYLTYEFLCAYFDSKFPESGISSKMSGVHYMLANLGFNVRLAVATKTGDPIILIPADQTLYGITYMTLGGEKFYVLGNRNANLAGSSLATCDLPKVASEGKRFNMLINGLNLPRKDRKFELNHGNLHLSGIINENIMPLIYRYPQMETSAYALSTLEPELRKNLISQFKSQLEGKDRLKATDELLQFVQSGFSYATDDDFHGFEKPYFLEENLFYPKNDCEDRSIFYTYFLWNALGVENQLLAFPGHESASVTLPGADIRGTSYEHEGKRYFISDPTYVGSSTGMCMRRYETTTPKIDYTYK